MPLPPPLDDEPPQSPEPSERQGFLSKGNPRATLGSVCRSALINALAIAGVWLVIAFVNDDIRGSWPYFLPAMILCGAIAGAVSEWQIDREKL